GRPPLRPERGALPQQRLHEARQFEEALHPPRDGLVHHDLRSAMRSETLTSPATASTNAVIPSSRARAAGHASATVRAATTRIPARRASRLIGRPPTPRRAAARGKRPAQAAAATRARPPRSAERRVGDERRARR